MTQLLHIALPNANSCTVHVGYQYLLNACLLEQKKSKLLPSNMAKVRITPLTNAWFNLAPKLGHLVQFGP